MENIPIKKTKNTTNNLPNIKIHNRQTKATHMQHNCNELIMNPCIFLVSKRTIQNSKGKMQEVKIKSKTVINLYIKKENEENY